VKLKRFNIKNYKSIKELGSCEVDDKITVLAGKNESGKTNILEALFKIRPEENFEEKDKTLGEEEDPVISALFIITDNEIDKIIEKITSKYSLEFDKNQIAGFKKSNKEITIAKNGDDYSIFGELYEGILTIRNKLPKEASELIKEINDIFISNGKDFQEELKISIDDKTPLKILVTQINSFTQKANENINLIDDSHKKIIQKKNDQLKETTPKLQKYPQIENIDEIFRLAMPNFVIFKSFDEEKINDSISLEEAKQSQFVKDLSKINDKLDVATIIKKQTDDYYIQNFQENYSASISKDFMDYWEPDKKEKINIVDIKLRVANNKISFFVSNPKTNRQFYPSQRSKGFQWFLSFYTRILSNTKDGNNNIILIDEPGLFLHAKAQSSVLKVLNNLSERDQIIYSTHSPYLIEEDNLERIKLVEKDRNDFTYVVNKFYDTKDQDTLTPILTAIGHDVFSGITFDEKKRSVVVEGISDYIIITSIFNKLKLTNNFYLIPMKGANSIGKYVPFFIGWNLKFIVLLDNDKKGEEVRDELTKKWLVEEKKILHISDNLDNTIEDLFLHKEYFEEIMGKSSNEYDLTKKISEQLTDSKKVLAAKELSRKLQEGKIELSDETLDHFKSIHSKIKAYFGDDQ